MSKRKQSDATTEKNVAKNKYKMSVVNRTLVGGKTYAPGIHIIDKQDYDVLKGSKHSKIKVFIEK